MTFHRSMHHYRFIQRGQKGRKAERQKVFADLLPSCSAAFLSF